MSEEAQICEICKKPKIASSKASLTQWISTCVCNLESVDSPTQEKVEVCQDCGKRIGEAKIGSLTQFIFRTDFCKCNKPKAKLERKLDFYNPPQLEKDILVEEDLDVDASKFPSTRYKPLRLLGQGASGSVYLAHDSNLNKYVGLKLLNTSKEEHLIAFQEEAKATSKLNHSSIIKIIDFGIANEQSPYMVLEYFDAKPLDKLIEENGPIHWQLAVKITLELCKALSYSHSLGIFHRDIKPGNVLVRIEDDVPQIRVIDFGVARLTEKEVKSDSIEGGAGFSLVGTPAYMSPDLFNGLEYDSCSEVYSIGCVLFELLTGQTPYADDLSRNVIKSHLEDSVPLVSAIVDVPAKLDDIISKCLSKEKRSRFRTPQQLEEALIEFREAAHQIKSESTSKLDTIENEKSKYNPIPFICLSILLIGIGIYLFFPKKQKLEASKDTDNIINIAPRNKLFSDAFRMKENQVEIKIESRGNINDEDLNLIKNVIKGQKPIELSIVGQEIYGSGLKYLADLQIKTLSIRNCPLKDQNANNLSLVKSIKNIALTKMKVTEAYINAIQKMPNITTLDFEDSNFDENNLESLFWNDKLRKINLTNTAISDSVLGYLVNCPNLKMLVINNCPNLTSEGFKNLQPLEKLYYIDVIDTHGFDDKAVAICSRYKDLTMLHFGGANPLSPQSLLSLSKSKSLYSLSVYDLRPFSNYLKYIAKLKNITRLKINDTDLKESDFNELLKMKQLKSLTISAIPTLSQKSTNKLKKLLPKTTKLKTDVYKIDQSVEDAQQLFLHY